MKTQVTLELRFVVEIPEGLTAIDVAAQLAERAAQADFGPYPASGMSIHTSPALYPTMEPDTMFRELLDRLPPKREKWEEEG